MIRESEACKYCTHYANCGQQSDCPWQFDEARFAGGGDLAILRGALESTKEYAGKWLAELEKYRAAGLTPAEVAELVHDGLPAALDKLAAYESTGLQPDECGKLADAKVDGRLVVLPTSAKEGDPKPSCFHMETGSPWCLGLAHGDDDYPISNCQKCWYSEYAAADREEPEAALATQEK